jgi:hypothetical protein
MKDRIKKCLVAIGFFFCFALLTWNMVLASYPAPVFKAAGVYAEGQGTYFWAFLTGPSPEDVASFTVTGPSGTFNLATVLSYRQLGVLYYRGEGSILGDGSYTFLVTDGLGRTASVTKEFAYDGTVPQIDPSTMSPKNGAYVGTTCPTLSFDSVTGHDVYYQVVIEDSYSKAIWFSSPHTQNTSYTVPQGLLQPNTPYWWEVRVWDKATDAQNRTVSDRRYFYTGTRGLPDITSNNVLTFPSGGDIGNWFGVRNVGIANWDIDYLRVIGPDSTVYDLDQIESRFYMPAVYLNTTYASTPIPDGTYRFEIQDDEGNTATAVKTYAYNPVPAVSEASRTPADNAYLDTNRPTFSWSAVEGGGPYYYLLRIHDYNQRIKWYTSDPITETSFTLPEGVNLPGGSSYKWQVLVWDAAENNLNPSAQRTFTVSASAPTVTTDPASSVSTTVATLNGKVNPNGAAGMTYYFEYGPDSDYGSSTPVQSLDSGASDVSVSADITDLTTCTTYHYRIVGTNYSGTSYGDDVTFPTSGCLGSSGGCFIGSARWGH